jgi:hypothetical protein
MVSSKGLVCRCGGGRGGSRCSSLFTRELLGCPRGFFGACCCGFGGAPLGSFCLMFGLSMHQRSFCFRQRRLGFLACFLRLTPRFFFGESL